MPSEEWLRQVKSELPLNTIIRLLQHLAGKVEEMCAVDEGAVDELQVQPPAQSWLDAGALMSCVLGRSRADSGVHQKHDHGGPVAGAASHRAYRESGQRPAPPSPASDSRSLIQQVIRKYQPNHYTGLWFTAFMWGVIFLQNQILPLYDGASIKLFTVTCAADAET